MAMHKSAELKHLLDTLFSSIGVLASLGDSLISST